MNTSQVRSGDTTHKRLASVMDFGDEKETLYLSGHLKAILRHQLATPLYLGLSYLDPFEARELADRVETRDLMLTRLGDLIHETDPSPGLLAVAKSFAKRSRLGCGASLPKEVATVIYFMTIAVALMRCNTRISSLSLARIVAGLDWSIKQTWVDADLRHLLEESRDFVVGMAADEEAEGSLCLD